MNENIDLTKILEGCPKGTELYSTVYGKVRFEQINNYGIYPIEIKVFNKFTNPSLVSVYFAKDGRCTSTYDGECTLFPAKDQRDWSKFERFWDKQQVNKFDPKTLERFDKVLARGHNGQNWTAIFFSHIDNSFNMAVCGAQYWRHCIPYNEETKHLCGTNNDCPDYYKWWEK